MTKPKARKRNPPDSTLRNIQAANKKIAVLKKRIEDLEYEVAELQLLFKGQIKVFSISPEAIKEAKKK